MSKPLLPLLLLACVSCDLGNGLSHQQGAEPKELCLGLEKQQVAQLVDGNITQHTQQRFSDPGEMVVCHYQIHQNKWELTVSMARAPAADAIKDDARWAASPVQCESVGVDGVSGCSQIVEAGLSITVSGPANVLSMQEAKSIIMLIRAQPNNSFKPNPLRSTSNMAD